jgi:hypothetical protein
MKRTSHVLAVAAALLFGVPVSHATILTFGARLDGPTEGTPSLGTGSATVIIDDVADTMHVLATFSGLTGTTTNAHIHCCTTTPFTGTAGVATTLPSFPGFPLGVTSGTFDNTFNLLLASSWNPAFITANGGTPASAEDAFIAGMLAGRTYFNIHTTAFPGGEIRGFLVPEPGMMGLLLLALGAGLIATLRKTRLAATR